MSLSIGRERAVRPRSGKNDVVVVRVWRTWGWTSMSTSARERGHVLVRTAAVPGLRTSHMAACDQVSMPVWGSLQVFELLQHARAHLSVRLASQRSSFTFT